MVSMWYRLLRTKQLTFLGLLLSILVLTDTNPLVAQNEPTSPATDNHIMLDFRSDKSRGKPHFMPDGIAYRRSQQVDLRRGSVTLTVQLPDAGEVRFMESGKSLAQFETRRKANESVVELIVRPVKPIQSRRQLENQAEAKVRKLLAEFQSQATKEMKGRGADALRNYIQSQNLIPPTMEEKLLDVAVQARTVELGSPRMLEQLQSLTQEHPTWISPEDQARYPRLTSQQRFVALKELYTLELAAQYIQDWGLKLDIKTLNGGRRIISKLDGMDAIFGFTSGEGSGAARGLERREIDELRERTQIAGEVVYFPATDPLDSNSQWFHGQRVPCTIRGTDRIRIEGTLQASAHDAVDWWILANFDANTMQVNFSASASVTHELYTDRVQGTRLRVHTSSSESLSYTFEIIPQSTSGNSNTKASSNLTPVVIHESPVRSDAKFPF